MCGILGEITNNFLSESEFKDLLDLSLKRGPDQQGIWKDNYCQLGFNRLAILDLSLNGKQPLISPNGRFAMVFNGEIYNYKDLQKKYHISQNNLRSTSDAEILCHLLEHMPIAELVKELNGMFAIAVWDMVSQKLFLIRDFAGIKPLFYGLFKDGIVFASQFDQIFQHPIFKNKKLRPEIMKEYFGLGFMQAPNTVFENIFQVEVGHYLEWDLKEKKTLYKQNYFPWITSPEIEETSPQASSIFKKYFNIVIKSQIQSDVPVATFLSSGIDSTLVTAYAKKYKENIQAFTFGIDDLELNESDIAAQYAEILKVEHIIEKNKQSKLLEIIDEHFLTMTEPFGDYSSVPTFLISKRAKQHATVMLSGDGGDELFWGYPRFIKSVHQSQWFRYPLWLRKLIIPFFRKFNKELSRGLDIFPKFSDWILFKQIHFNDLDKLFPNTAFSVELFESYNSNGAMSKDELLLYLKRNEYYSHMQRILRKVDLTSMGNSLEVRVPFLDKNIITFSNRVMPALAIKHNNPKLILKNVLYSIINSKLVNKKKKGFTVPIDIWLREDLKLDFIRTVVETPFFGFENLNKEYLDSLISDFYQNRNNRNPWGIWHLYAWQKWALNNKLV